MKRNGNTAGKIDHICRYFPEYTELLLALVLAIFAVITLMPQFLLPAATVYPAYWVKLIFGLIMGIPTFGLLILRLRTNIHEYIYNNKKLRKWLLFGVSFNYFYITALRGLIQIWPPGYVICLVALLLLSIILYLRVTR
jgi:hypothetical protein